LKQKEIYMTQIKPKQPAKIKSYPLQTIQTESNCCATTEEGASICIVPESGKGSGCGCQSTLSSPSETDEERPLSAPKKQTAAKKTNHFQAKIKSGILFGVACLASPCCAPLYVSLALVLLAGTPAAIWLSANLGWVYGGLTLLALASFFLAYRWWPRFTGQQ
jgi:hypothetical protein